MATFDIPEACLHTEMDKDVIMFLERALYEIMVKVALPIHQKYSIMIIKGKPIYLFIYKRRCMAYY